MESEKQQKYTTKTVVRSFISSVCCSFMYTATSQFAFLKFTQFRTPFSHPFFANYPFAVLQITHSPYSSVHKNLQSIRSTTNSPQ